MLVLTISCYLFYSFSLLLSALSLSLAFTCNVYMGYINMNKHHKTKLNTWAWVVKASLGLYLYGVITQRSLIFCLHVFVQIGDMWFSLYQILQDRSRHSLKPSKIQGQAGRSFVSAFYCTFFKQFEKTKSVYNLGKHDSCPRKKSCRASTYFFHLKSLHTLWLWLIFKRGKKEILSLFSLYIKLKLHKLHKKYCVHFTSKCMTNNL